MSKRKYEEDDGRTIVDMSGVGPNAPFEPEKKASRQVIEEETEEKPFDPRDYMPVMTKQERRWYILGALKAALLIGGAFVLGLGLLTLILVLIWT